MATATANQRITPELKAYIAEAIQNALADPDLGLELTDEIKERLRASEQDKGPYISLEEVKKRYL